MKAKKINYKRLLLSFGALLIVAAVAAIIDHSIGISTTGTLASMALIGSIDDVSDRETTGSMIGYRVWLLHVSQIDMTKDFPLPNNLRQVTDIPLKAGELWHYFECHDIPTYLFSGEKGDITTTGTNTLTLIMGGIRSVLLNFIDAYAGGKFIMVYQKIGSKDKYIVGSVDRPMILSSYEGKDDKDGRYITFTFTRSSIESLYYYVGTIAEAAPVIIASGTTNLALQQGNDRYIMSDGEAATYAIDTVSGISSTDVGRTITITGVGSAHPATITDGSHFVLNEGATWTAKQGASITFQVFDSQTLVELPGTRVEIA